MSSKPMPELKPCRCGEAEHLQQDLNHFVCGGCMSRLTYEHNALWTAEDYRRLWNTRPDGGDSTLRDTTASPLKAPTKPPKPSTNRLVVECTCMARSQSECGCHGVDWRSAREKELEAWFEHIDNAPLVSTPPEECIEKSKTYNHRRIDSNILFYAFRYALGRTSYAVGDVVDCLLYEWPRISLHLRRLIQKEIMEADEGSIIGHECDRMQWRRILAMPLDLALAAKDGEQANKEGYDYGDVIQLFQQAMHDNESVTLPPRHINAVLMALRTQPAQPTALREADEQSEESTDA